MPAFPPISVGSTAFSLLALVLVLAAWWHWLRPWFVPLLVLFNAAMLVSWMRGPWDLVALALFLAPPYLVARALWNTGTVAPAWLTGGTIASQIACFLVLRHYPGWDVTTSIGHPVSLIGVSYIMFRQIHVVMDAPYSAEEFSPAIYFAYLTSIWTLTAGPIQRYPDFVAGLQHVGRPNGGEVLSAAHRIATGILKAFLFAPVFLASSKLTVPEPGEYINPLRWIASFYSYFIFLYLDFSGYTDIVIGAARLCLLDTLPENFDRPYLSRNVQEFWARWHMSLGTWFRDYFYTPLFRFVGESTGWRSYFGVNVLVLTLTFLAVGAWHGPGLNFVVFGALQAGGVVAAVAWRKLQEENPRFALLRSRWSAPIARVICFHYVCGSFLFLDNSVGGVWNFLSAFGTWVAHG